MSDDPFEGEAALAFTTAVDSGQKFGGSRYPTMDTYSTADIKANQERRSANAGYYQLRGVLEHVESQFGKSWLTDNDHPVSQFLQQYAVPMAAGAANQFLRMAGAVSDLPEQTVNLETDPWTMMGAGSMRSFKTNIGGSELGIFGGVNARTANEMALRTARMADDAGISPREIFQETGFVKFPDGQWRFEISDTGAKFTPQMEKLNAKYSADSSSKFAVREVPLGTVLDHPEFFRAYPEAKDVKTTIEIGMSPGEGSIKGRGLYDPGANHLFASGANLNDALSVMLHESQHFIQSKKELFAQGGSPSGMKNTAESFIVSRDMHEAKSRLESLMMDLADSKSQAVNVAVIRPDLRTPAQQKQYDRAVTKFKETQDALTTYKARLEKEMPYPTASENAYYRLMGEVEARLVQARQHLSTGERRDLFPLDNAPHGIDVPIEKQFKDRRQMPAAQQQKTPPSDNPLEGRIPPILRQFETKAERNAFAEASIQKRVDYVRQGGDPTLMEGIDKTFAPFDLSKMSETDKVLRFNGIQKVADQVEAKLMTYGPEFTVEREVSRAGTTYLVFKRNGKEPFEVRLADHADLKKDRLSIDPVTGNRPDDIVKAFEYHYGFTDTAPTVGWGELKTGGKSGNSWSRQIGGTGKYMRIEEHLTPVKREQQLFSVVPVGGGDGDE